jgi:hypothetical protein
MMEFENLNELTAEIMAQGYDEQTASDYAIRIGDRPMFDTEGNVMVMKGDQLLAVLKPLKFFLEE